MGDFFTLKLVLVIFAWLILMDIVYKEPEREPVKIDHTIILAAPDSISTAPDSLNFIRKE